MRRSPATLAGFAAAVIMVALIGAISMSGKWPNDAPLDHPVANGILAMPADRVMRAEISVGDDTVVFERQEAGGWLRNGAVTESAISTHIDAALHLLNVSAPRRILGPDDYSEPQFLDFGLDPPRMLLTVMAADGTTTGFAFGEATPAQNSQYVRVLGQPRLYLLSRYVGVEWQIALDMAGRVAPSDAAAEATARPGIFLLPVSLAEISAVEIVMNGALTRFERDPAGDWFRHVGQHVHGPGGIVHRADPKLAPLIATELTALERASIESVVTHHPDSDTLGSFGLAHPSAIMVLYTRDSSQPVARVEFGNLTVSGFNRYARVQEADSVVAVPDYEAAHLNKLLQIAGAGS